MRRKKMRYRVQQKNRRLWPLSLLLLFLVLLLPIPGSNPSMAPLSYLMRFASGVPSWLTEPSGTHTPSIRAGSSTGGHYLSPAVVNQDPVLDWSNTESFSRQAARLGNSGFKGAGPAGEPGLSPLEDVVSVLDGWLPDGFSVSSMSGFSGGGGGGGNSGSLAMGSGGGFGGGGGFGSGGGEGYKPQYVENHKPGGGGLPGGDDDSEQNGSDPDSSTSVPEPGIGLLTGLGILALVVRRFVSERG